MKLKINLSHKSRCYIGATLFMFTFTRPFSFEFLDCLACWELRKVEIVLSNGNQINGFLKWNESWVNYNFGLNPKVWRNRFPESLVEMHLTPPNPEEINVITKLWTVKNDSLFKFNVITNKDQIKVSSCDIRSIIEIDKTIKFPTGAGDIPIYTIEEIEILNTNPFAVFELNGDVSDVYFLSFNPKIDRSQLIQICKSNYWERKDELAKQKVIIVEISFD